MKSDLIAYYLEADDLVLHLRGEARQFEPIVLELIEDDSADSDRMWDLVWAKRAQLAERRLNKLKGLNPPREAQHIHQACLRAFEQGLMGRRETAKGNSLAAAKAMDAAAEELVKLADMWMEMGLSPVDTLEDLSSGP